MTLGRTSSGAIKIKTDGGLRAVACACCGGCGCNGIQLINPPEDPNFTKKVLGTDPNIPQFTQVNISWGMHTGSDNLDFPPEFNQNFQFQNITATWPNTNSNGFLYAQGVDGCGDEEGSFYSMFFPGQASPCNNFYSGNANLDMYPGFLLIFTITPSGCVEIYAREDITSVEFVAYNPEIHTEYDYSNYPGFDSGYYSDPWITYCDLEGEDDTLPSRPSEADQRVVITINGQRYPALVIDNSYGQALAPLFSGFVTINFS